jgi:raffinose/stachyose/melibiose transport system permease protein
VVLIGCLVFLTPVIVMVVTALQPNANVVANGPAAFPTSLTLSNFPAAWSTGALGGYYLNSIMINLVKVPTGVVIASLAAYPLSIFRFRGRKLVLVALLVGLGVPQVITLYPLLQLSRVMDLSGSVWVLFLPYLAFGFPFQILVMRGAFTNVPREIIESARIDGATERRIWAKICMPMVLPSLASLAVLDAVAGWNEFVIALTLINGQSSETLPLGINNLVGEFGTNFAQLSAGTLICVVPMVLLFFIARRYLTRGVAAGAVKG